MIDKRNAIVHLWIIWIFLGATFCTMVGYAKSESVESRRSVVMIPLEPYLKDQTIARATVNGHAGTFLFDTGEGISSISPAFAKLIGCKPWGRITGFRMSGERLDSPHCDGIKFAFPGQTLLAPSVMTIDIMALMGSDVPPIDGALGLDIFADRAITIVPRKSIVIETPESLAARIASGQELSVRIVRDSEGVALTVDAAVRTSAGVAWMELDTGNGGATVIANHIAALLGLKTDISTPQKARFNLANGIHVEGLTRTRDLIMDGNIGAQFLNSWILTLDLQHGRAWLSPYTAK